MLVFADSLSDDDLKSLHAKGFPMVLVHRMPPADTPIPSVTVENKNATFRLVEHLIVHHDKRRILFMRGSDHQEDSCWRETGYRSALDAKGIPIDERLILNGIFERKAAYETLSHFLGMRTGRISTLCSREMTMRRSASSMRSWNTVFECGRHCRGRI